MTSSVCTYCGRPLERFFLKNNGREQFCGFKPCDCEGARIAREEREARERELNEREARKRRAEKVRRAGIPKRYCHADGDFQCHIDAIGSGKSLVFTGGVGTGKTYAACAVALRLIDEMSVRFSSLAGINAKIFSEGATEAAVLSSLSHCGPLILDDLGKEKPSEWLVSLTYKVVNERYERERPIIVTTNYSMAELHKRLCVGGDSTTADAIASRLYEMCDGRSISFGNEDRRLRSENSA